MCKHCEGWTSELISRWRKAKLACDYKELRQIALERQAILADQKPDNSK